MKAWRGTGAAVLGLVGVSIALLFVFTSSAAGRSAGDGYRFEGVPSPPEEAPLEPVLPPPTQRTAASTVGNQKIASNLGLLLALEEVDAGVHPDRRLGQTLDRLRSEGVVEISARFTHSLSPDEMAQVEALGVQVQRLGGVPAHFDRFYGLVVPTGAVDDLAGLPFTEWLESAWHPAVYVPLDVSVVSSTVPAVWGEVSPGSQGVPLTGEGVTIANFDTGVDVHHPAFLDGSTALGPSDCLWDSSGNGTFDPGLDAFPGGGALRYWDPLGDPFNTGSFDLTQDWIYGDTNGNFQYDYTESLYQPFDVNGNGLLETVPVSECLRSLGSLSTGIHTSKIAATLDANGQHVRGVDLHQTISDTNGHGTGVAGILVGGTARWCDPAGLSCDLVYTRTRRYTGVAPDADLLVADRINVAETTYIPWAAGLGARVMLHEYGSWTGHYLDGSSNVEQLMDATSNISGVVQVVPTGNLHGQGRHLQYDLPSGSFTPAFSVPVGLNPRWVYVTMLWLTPTNNMTVTLTTSGGGIGNTAHFSRCVTAGSGWWRSFTGDGHEVWCERAVNSTRGTALYNIYISRTVGVASGVWPVQVHNRSGSVQPTNFYVADDATSWGGGVEWDPTFAAGGMEKHTATWPSTCDTCIGVASYATRGYVDSATPGSLSAFSGRGPRFFDGAQVVDVAAPGHYDVVSTESKDASWGGPSGALGKYSCKSPVATNGCFGGTSAAGPHVAGVAALLVQYAAGDADPSEVAAAIQQGARTDADTGSTPNADWGYGKLDAYGAYLAGMHDLGDAPDSTNNHGMAMSAYPGVPANFPTVYTGTGQTAPHGPLHRQAGNRQLGPIDACLGWTVSAEAEADGGYDEDLHQMAVATHNISPTIDGSNGEDIGPPSGSSDDGVWPPPVLTHCVPSTLTYRVTLASGSAITRYVNAWFDWNGDGDWGDVFTCTTSGDAPEWAVRDQVVPYTLSGTYTVTAPAFLPSHYRLQDVLWMRLTLSEQRAPLNPSTGLADGRGPAGGYAYGETEDYLLSARARGVYLPLVLRSG